MYIVTIEIRKTFIFVKTKKNVHIFIAHQKVWILVIKNYFKMYEDKEVDKLMHILMNEEVNA